MMMIITTKAVAIPVAITVEITAARKKIVINTHTTNCIHTEWGIHTIFCSQSRR